MILRLVLVLAVIASIVLEVEPVPAPHNDPFKPIYKILKEYRKVQKYKYKYGRGGGILGLGGLRGSDDSDESGEDNPFQFLGFNNNNNNNNNNRQTGGGNNGGGNGQRLPGNNGNGGGQDPLRQVGTGIDNIFQGLGSLSLGQLFGIPNN